jgi:hypothetical protein
MEDDDNGIKEKNSEMEEKAMFGEVLTPKKKVGEIAIIKRTQRPDLMITCRGLRTHTNDIMM